MSRVAVVGGGISGLVAAWSLATGWRPGPDTGSGAPIAGSAAGFARQDGGGERHEVVLVEAGDRLGGKIRTSPFTGRAVDEGADSFVGRGGTVLAVCRALGLERRLTSPATGRAFVWADGALRPLPAGLVLGVPTALRPLARSGLVSARGVARAALDLVLPGRPPVGDVAVADLVTRRLGREVQRRLVEPLVGAIHAGDTAGLSAEVAAPQLVAAARHHRSLVLGLRAESRRSAVGGGPMFRSVAGGLGELVEALGAALVTAGAEVRLGEPVAAVERTARAWRVHPDNGPAVAADAVVVAVPAPAAARLLSPLSPEAAAPLAALAHASVAVVTLAYGTGALARPLDGAGFLVPAGAGHLLTACSWASAKWDALRSPDVAVLRASVGRAGDDRHAGLDDGELVEQVHRDLIETMGVGDGPQAARVSRWPGAFPQYRPGHLARIEAVEAALAREAPGVAVAGAAYRGIGIATCAGGALAAAERTRAWLGRR